MDLDEIKIKELTELTEEDKKALNQNWSSLSDDEREIFSSIHKEDQEFKLPFKSQAELDDYVSKQVSSTIEAQKKAAEEEEASKKAAATGESYLPPGFKAKDWEEPFKIVVPKIVEKVVKEIDDKNAARRQKLDEINKEFDKEFDNIVSANPNLPKKGTKEREDWETEVSQVGQKYKVHTMTDAFEIWKVVHKEVEPGADTVEITREGRPVTSLASKVGRGYGTGTAPKKTVYKVGGGQRLDDLLEARKREEGIE